MGENILSASGTQFGLIVNSDGSLNIGSMPPLSVTTGSVNITNANLLISGGVHNEEVYTQRLDYNADGTIRYQGLAPPGTGQGSPSWQIRRFTWSNNLTTAIEFSSGLKSFTSAWSLRSGTNESYS